MSVSSERSCSSPASSNSDSGQSGHMKLKRRWIQMSSIDEDTNSEQLPVDLSPSLKRFKTPSIQQKIHPSLKSYSTQNRYTLPEDPRDWTKKDVLKWLNYMVYTYDLDISQHKFDMNGKALCLMSMDMFVKRVPTGGKLLYRDFRLRLYPAVFFQKKSKSAQTELSPLELLALTTGKYFP